MHAALGGGSTFAGSGGLHCSERVLAPASSSSMCRGLPLHPAVLPQQQHSQRRPLQQQPHQHCPHPLHTQRHLHRQQQGALAAAASGAAGGDAGGSLSGSGSPKNSSSDITGTQAFQFKHVYSPQRQAHLPQGSWAAQPLQQAQQQAQPQSTQQAQEAQELASVAYVAGEQSRLDPEAVLWTPRGPRGSVNLRNPWAAHFRVTHVPPPLPASLPGSDWWHVEALNTYSRNWPSLKWVGGKLQFRPGFLEPFDDPKVVPFFFYRGLERVAYSWSDRAFQALFAAVYAGVHVALFGWLVQADPPLGVAVALNWGLGRLTLAKWGALLFLAWHGKMWLYFLYLCGKLVDAALAKLFPPVREFAWAMFVAWLLFLAVTPTYFYPLPFWPFAPGSLGVQEALL